MLTLEVRLLRAIRAVHLRVLSASGAKSRPAWASLSSEHYINCFHITSGAATAPPVALCDAYGRCSTTICYCCRSNSWPSLCVIWAEEAGAQRARTNLVYTQKDTLNKKKCQKNK